MNFRLLLFSLSIFLVSCVNTERNKNLKIFKYNEVSEVNTLDPAFSKDQASVWVCNQMYNGLVQLDSNLRVIPSIAKGWEILDSGLTYKFLLRNDVYFHNHEVFLNKEQRRVKASDFEYSFNRLIDERVASPGSWVLNNVDSFYAVNDSVFFIKLIKPFPAFLQMLSMQYCSVVSKKNFNKENKDFIGTGPFKFQFWKRGVKLVLRKNIDYFEKDDRNQSLPYLDAISISFIRDKQTAFLRFLQGEIDFISGIDASYKDEVLTRDGKLQDSYKDKIKLSTSYYLNTEYLGFYMNDSIPLKVRKAINLGFDRKKMIKYLRNNIGTPALNGFVPPGMPSFSNKVKGYEYNPELAKELLEKSDFDNEITLSTTSSYLDLCEYIQNELSKIGLKIKIDVNPPSTHRQMVATSKLSFFRGSWIADYPEAENYLSLFYSKYHSPNGPNYTHFVNKEFDSMYEKSFTVLNDSSRYLLFQKMDQLIIDSAVIVPLYYDYIVRLINPQINGFENNPMNLIHLKRTKK